MRVFPANTALGPENDYHRLGAEGRCFALDFACVPSPLAWCEHLLSEHLHAAYQRFGAAALGLTDLPPLTNSAVDAAGLRVAAVLYWAREVERTGLLDFVDALARQTMQGTLMLPRGDSVHRLVEHFRHGEERFARTERQAIYSSLFGGPGNPAPNENFGAAFRALVQTLTQIGRTELDHGIDYLRTRAASQALTLASGLSGRTCGVAAFAARDIVAQIRAALVLLRDADLVSALGGGDAWTILERWSSSVLQAPITEPARVFISRANAGLKVMSWIATAAPDRSSPAAPLSRTHEAVQAAMQLMADGFEEIRASERAA